MLSAELTRRLWIAAVAMVLVGTTGALVTAAQDADPGPDAAGTERAGGDWVTVDYGPIVERLVPTHSGESVGTVLERLDGRPAPPRGESSAVARDHDLLHPLLERYAHVLPDALDTMAGPPERGWVEIGWLYEPGEAAPAWVELLRSRRAVVESDGAGRVRVFAPVPADDGGGAGAVSPGERAWRAERSWLRHAIGAERRRLAAAGAGATDLRVEVYGFRHDPARTSFRLHLEPHVVPGDPTAPPAEAPPLDLTALERFLGTGMEIEGGRLDDGELLLIGSDTEEAPTLLGEPIGLADLAVAYRAVARGGRARPYMSLDRGFAPHRSLVTYGGRLADTRLGMVSLLCDLRFKTFSQGIDPHAGEDARERIRERIPGFRTHIERYIAHAERTGGGGQRTRLWFYPDDVRMLVDPEARMVALTRPRLTAAAERVALGASQPESKPAPWTRELTQDVNRRYEELSELFPELADLDRTVRLLGLFTWLDFARAQGRAVPDLDALLAVELPPLRTPRRFPQLLALDAFDTTDRDAPVEVFARPDVAAGLDRLLPAAGGQLLPRARLSRAVSGLDRRNPRHAALIQRISSLDPSQLSPSDIDRLAYQAERLVMHGHVVGTLSDQQRDLLRARERDGAQIDVLSIAIGGLDLGLGSSLRRGIGSSRALGLGVGAMVSPVVAGDVPTAGTKRDAGGGVPPSWKAESRGLPDPELPGFEADGGLERIRRWKRSDDAGIEVGVVHLPHSTAVRARELSYSAPEAAPTIRRVEGRFESSFRLQGKGGSLTATPVERQPVEPAPVIERLGADPPEGLRTLSLSRTGRIVADGSASTEVRVHLRAPGREPVAQDLPRSLWQGLVLGPQLAPERSPRLRQQLSRLAGGAEAGPTWMVMEDFARLGAPWEVTSPVRPGEEHPAHVARGLTALGRGRSDGMAGVVGTDPDRSPERWKRAQRPVADAALWLPEGAFPGRAGRLRSQLAESWAGGRVLDALPGEGALPGLIVLASAEPPGVLAARVRELAADPRMEGHHLAVFSLAGELRWDVPAGVLASTELGAIGLAGRQALDWQGVAEAVGRLSEAIAQAGDAPTRPERLDGPFVWIY